ncbi:MAG: SPOR domain-containing protein [Hyphomicrobiaceae bacterium]
MAGSNRSPILPRAKAQHPDWDAQRSHDPSLSPPAPPADQFAAYHQGWPPAAPTGGPAQPPPLQASHGAQPPRSGVFPQDNYDYGAPPQAWPTPPNPQSQHNPFDAPQQGPYEAELSRHGYYDPQQAPQQSPELQSWDLSQYATGPNGHGAQTGYDPSLQHQQYPTPYPEQSPAYPDPAYDQQGYAQGQGYDPRQTGNWDAYQQQQQAYPGYYQQDQGGYAGGYPDQHAYADPQHDGQEQYFEAEMDEPAPVRSGPRPVVVVAALVGAIALGGGLAYGYRMLGGGAPKGATPVVKADKSPTKVTPANPGGKTMAHTDKKFLNRLTDDKGSASAPTPVAGGPVAPLREPDGPRKVTTLIVNKDGTISPQTTAAPPPPAQVASATTQRTAIPGMVIEGIRPAQPRAMPAESRMPAAAEETPAPRVADLPLPKVRGTTNDVAERAPPKRKRPAVRDDALATKTALATEAPARSKSLPGTTGRIVGYVPVLASKRSREDALKTFADMHQRYASILTGKSPDVMEAHIANKGTYFRLILGPPASRESARDVCTKLDAAGFKGCWALGYRQ